MEEHYPKGIELPPLPETVTEYAPETDILLIYWDAELAASKPVAQGLTVFYDADGAVSGFKLESAMTRLKPLVDAVQAKNERVIWLVRPAYFTPERSSPLQ